MLNSEQEAAVSRMAAHCLESSESPFFLLEGPAGTGKTYCMEALVTRMKKRIIFTAPTNKAVRVLRDTLRSDTYKPECKTIYSLLGLTMQADGEVKVLVKPEDEIDLNAYTAVVVDEASMLSQVVLAHLREASLLHPHLRWLFMGDRWQLPPVGEVTSPVWDFPLETHKAFLTQIMRQDNQILTLSAKVRAQIETPFKAFAFLPDNDESEGVWAESEPDWTARIIKNPEGFKTGGAKAISWRNVIVDHLNSLIRQELFADHELYPWQPGDRITTLAPGKDLDSKPMVATDEESVVTRADVAQHPWEPDFVCWRIQARTEFNESLVLWSLHTSHQLKFKTRVQELAAKAKSDPRQWKRFWEFKELFHSIRHAYATTAHRAQGSTYEKAYVNWRDILRNPNRPEGYRCLYVAVTRPKKQLFLG